MKQASGRQGYMKTKKQGHVEVGDDDEEVMRGRGGDK